jgi:hypothetical protein
VGNGRILLADRGAYRPTPLDGLGGLKDVAFTDKVTAGRSLAIHSGIKPARFALGFRAPDSSAAGRANV